MNTNGKTPLTFTGQHWYDYYFMQSPVPMLEVDYGRILPLLNTLPESDSNDLQRYFEENHDALLAFIHGLGLVNVNHRVLKTFELDNLRQLLQIFPQIVTSEIQRVFISVLDVIKRSGKEYHTSVEILLPGRGIRKLDLSINFSMTAPGEPLCHRALVSLVDKTEMLWTTQIISEERDHSKRYLNLSNVLFLSLDPGGHIRQVNNKTCAVLGASRSELIGKNWIAEIVVPSARLADQSLFDQLASGEILSTPSHESQIFTAKGQIAIVDWHHAVLRNISGRVDEILSFGVDITRSRYLESQNRKMEIELQQTEKLKSLSILARGVAHEINNPLTAIMNYASIIADEDQNHELSRYASDVMEEGRRVSRIVSNFLSFARLDDSKWQITGVQGIMQNVKLLINHTLMNDGITFHIHEIDPKLYIRCKVQEIQHVLFNLLVNSWEAIRQKNYPPGAEKLIQVSARSISKDGSDLVRIELVDNGIGISARRYQAVFVPFLRSELRPPGIGLGLEVAYQIVRKHGGTLDFQSEENRGTTVSIELASETEGVFK